MDGTELTLFCIFPTSKLTTKFKVYTKKTKTYKKINGLELKKIQIISTAAFTIHKTPAEQKQRLSDNELLVL